MTASKTKKRSPTKPRPRKAAAVGLVPYSLKDIAAITTDLNEARKMFCWYFVFNPEMRNNATGSYAYAYGYDLSDEKKFPRDDAVYEEVEVGKDRRGKPVMERKMVRASTHERARLTCSVNAHRLLTNAKIQEYIVELRNLLLKDEIVDAELAKIIVQDDDLSAKVKAIQVFNGLRKRGGSDDKPPPGSLVQHFTQINIHPPQHGDET